jgi:hypothetical protein
MGTRGCIARRTGEFSFKGRYHHWDSYPSGLGAALFALNRGHFGGDTAAMLRVLLDEHKAGWSTILGADFSLPPEPVDGRTDDAPRGPSCYCHGGRSETASLLTEKNAAGSGVEYAYAFTDGGAMLVLSSYHPSGGKMVGYFGSGNPRSHWRLLATVNLDGDAPNWEAIEARGGDGAPVWGAHRCRRAS